MARTAESAALPVVDVGGKAFPVGPITVHQLFCAKNLVVNIILGARVRAAQRNAELTMQAQREVQDQTFREQLAAKIGISAEDFAEAKAMQVRLAQLMDESGFGGDQVGIILDILSALSESQIEDIARLILDRDTDTRITLDFVRKHFALDWLIEALVLFLQQNHLPSLIKNLQRLATMYRMQEPAPAETSTASDSTNNSNAR